MSSDSDATGYPSALRSSSAGSIGKDNTGISSQSSMSGGSMNAFNMQSFSPLNGVVRNEAQGHRALATGFNTYGSSFGRQSQHQYISSSSQLPMYQNQTQQQQQQHQQLNQQQQQQFVQQSTYHPSGTTINSNTWSSLGMTQQQTQKQSQYYSGLASRTSSNSSAIGSVARSAFTGNVLPDPLGFSGQILEDEDLDSDGSISAQLHRRDLEVQALKLEVKRLNGLLQHPDTNENEQDVYRVDPAVEQAFRDMAKSLQERDGEIAKLQYHLEATMAAIGAGNPTSKNSIKGSNAKVQFYDQGELAHRLVTRITALRDENKLLGVSSFDMLKTILT